MNHVNKSKHCSKLIIASDQCFFFFFNRCSGLVFSLVLCCWWRHTVSWQRDSAENRCLCCTMRTRGFIFMPVSSQHPQTHVVKNSRCFTPLLVNPPWFVQLQKTASIRDHQHHNQTKTKRRSNCEGKDTINIHPFFFFPYLLIPNLSHRELECIPSCTGRQETPWTSHQPITHSRHQCNVIKPSNRKIYSMPPHR